MPSRPPHPSHKQSQRPSLPPVDPKRVERIRRLRALQPRTDNSLRVVSVLCGRAAAPAPDLCAAVEALAQRHPRADFRWQWLRVNKPPAKRSRLPALKSSIAPQLIHATSFDAALEIVAHANLYLVAHTGYTRRDLEFLRYAMALGVPVVGPSEPAAATDSVIHHGIDGMAVAYADTGALVTALARVLFDLDLRMRMSNAGPRTHSCP